MVFKGNNSKLVSDALSARGVWQHETTTEKAGSPITSDTQFVCLATGFFCAFEFL